MQPSLNNQSSPQKVRNILIRHSCSKEVRFNSPFQPPERFHLLKYFPKYYHTLSLEVTKEYRLQSKIKKIKKLKNFKGYFKEVLPSKLWLNLLSNARKEIEEIPQTTTIQSSNRPSRKLSPVFWARLMLWKVKFFPNITSLFLPRRKTDYIIPDYDDTSLVKKPFIGYLKNLRKLKTLEVFPGHGNNVAEKRMREKLDGMGQFLNRLEKLTIKTFYEVVNLQGIVRNKKLLSHLTGLAFSPALKKFDSNLLLIPEMCKNLRFLSIGFGCYVDNNPEFLKFLTLIQGLPLLGLELGLPRRFEYYWEYFKPQASLRSLKLRFDVADLIKANFFTTGGLKDIDLCMGLLLGHWEDIPELDELEFRTSCVNINDLVSLRMFITLIMKKVRKLGSFKCSLYTGYSGLKVSDSLTCEPILVEEVPHLYESLQKFEYILPNSTGDGEQLKFDLKKMKAFKNLREFILEKNALEIDGIEEIVELLERNQKEGDFLPALELRVWSISSSDWLGDILKRISHSKRPEKNLKVVIDLRLKMDDLVGDFLSFMDEITVKELSFLDELCDVRKSVGFIKGLLVCLRFHSRDYKLTPISVEALREVMRRYSEMRNMVVEMSYVEGGLHFRKIDGEEEQLWD